MPKPKETYYLRWTVSFFDKDGNLVQNTFDSTEGVSYNTYMQYLQYYGVIPSVTEEKLQGKFWKNQ